MQALISTNHQSSILEKLPAVESANYLVHLVGEAPLVLLLHEDQERLAPSLPRPSSGVKPPDIHRHPAASEFILKKSQESTGWGSHLFQRFCNMFSESSPCLLGQHGSCSPAQWPGELLENMLQTLRNKLPPPDCSTLYQ